MILIATGLSTMPEDVFEGALIDGANRLQRFWYITIPLLKQSLLAVLVIGFIKTFKVFDLIFIITKGGPVHATEVLSTLAYHESFTNFNFSIGATVANILFVILFLVSLVYMRLTDDAETGGE
jgi:multiple sugar transport system permease protein